MRIGVSYKQQKPEDRYDVICIGSGLGSLTCAAMLSKMEGKKVLVLEKHYTAGGFTHVFHRKDFEWDVGLHYIGEVIDPKTILSRLFAYVTDHRLEWADMGPVYDRIFIQDRVYDFPKGKEAFRQSMKERFPDTKDHQAVDKYLELINDSVKRGNGFYMDRVFPGWLSSLIGWYFRNRYYRYSDRTTLEVLQSLTSNQELIAVLAGQFGDYGLPPAQSSFAMHAVLVKHYLKGGAYPVGGSSRIAQTILPLIEKNGGRVMTNAPVKSILIQNGKTTGVIMEDGNTIYANHVVSGTGVLNTINHLIPRENLPQEWAKSITTRVKPSVSHLCLYIGLYENAEALKLPKSNFWIYPGGPDHDKNVENFLRNPDEADLPVVYVSFPSAKDPLFEKNYPGRSTIEIITMTPYDWFKQWEGTSWKKRGEDYEAVKEKWAKRLLEVLFEKLPHLRGKEMVYELSTPLSTKQFANYDSGEIYGLEHTPERFRVRELRPKTPIPNFWITGQDVVTVGIGGALFAGLLTASAITGKNLFSRMMADVPEGKYKIWE